MNRGRAGVSVDQSGGAVWIKECTGHHQQSGSGVAGTHQEIRDRGDWIHGVPQRWCWGDGGGDPGSFNKTSNPENKQVGLVLYRKHLRVSYRKYELGSVKRNNLVLNNNKDNLHIFRVSLLFSALCAK